MTTPGTSWSYAHGARTRAGYMPKEAVRELAGAGSVSNPRSSREPLGGAARSTDFACDLVRGGRAFVQLQETWTRWRRDGWLALDHLVRYYKIPW